MNSRQVFGIGFIVLGLFIILTGASITGSVIGFQPANFLSWFGIFVMAAGIVMVLITRETPFIKEESNLIKMINQNHPGANETNCEILIDADFVKVLEKEKKEIPKYFFGNYESRIPQEVYDEMTRISRRTGGPLVSRKTLSYLLSIGAKILSREEFVPTEIEKDKLIGIWDKVAPGKNIVYDRGRFRRGGDIHLLAYALRKGQGPYTIILSNNTEIHKVAEELRNQKYNIAIYNTRTLWP